MHKVTYKRDPWKKPPSKSSDAGRVLEIVQQAPLEGLLAPEVFERSGMAREDVYRRLSELTHNGWIRRTLNRPYRYFPLRDNSTPNR